MEQNINPTMEQTQAEKLARREQAAKIKRRKKRAKRILGAAITLAICGGIAFGIYSLFKEEELVQTPWSEMVYRGSLTSMVEGSGITRAKDSETLTLTAGGVVQEIFVTEGQLVAPGDPLYTVSSEDAEEDLEAAQDEVDDIQDQMNDLAENYGDLIITAPFAGKLTECADLEVGDTCSAGTEIATLVEDGTLKLSLYFSYAYESSIFVGQSAQVSLPASMTTVAGTVSAIHKVERISDEGSKLFEVEVTLKNPGTLTEGMVASAVLGDGIYPYDAGELAYNRTHAIVAEATGEVLSINLRDYATVGAGATLAQLAGEDLDDQMADLQTSMDTALEGLKTAESALSNYNAVASIPGYVMSLSLVVGEEVEAGRVALSIADTTTMIVDAQVDERNVSFVKPGMSVDIIQRGMDGDNYLWGTVESVSLEGSFENGMSTFPAVIKVDNYDGFLMSGMNVSYSLMASQSENCLLVPQQAVKYTEAGTIVFIQSETEPENVVSSELMGGMTIPEGYYPVPVTVGLSDQTSAEIIQGVEEGQMVFIQYMTDQGNSWDDMGGGMGMMVG
ncbi:MAG: HlyD family efflux transporter periplasmic adaptor subunit [Eubacteriales bacterium]